MVSFPRSIFLILCAVFVVLCLPIQVGGTLLGRSLAGNPRYPCRIAEVPSSIPVASIYARPLVIIVVSGILPFACIFIEVFFIFASLWSYKYYYVYGFLIAILGTCPVDT